MVCISKVTYDIVNEVAPEVSSTYLPHSVDPQYFHQYITPEEKKRSDEVRKRILDGSRNHFNKDKKIFFWNSRNARRKQSGTMVWWFKEFLDQVGHDQATLLMHTDPRDQHGTDLPHIIEHLGVNDGQVLISADKVDSRNMADMYNAAHFTVSISDAEGFGLSMLESLSCGTPIIATMTGGLQEQITDGKKWFGYGIEPASKSIIGSLQVPYIYEDRISQEDFNTAMKKALEIRPAAYKKMATNGLEHVAKNYNFDNFGKKWVDLMDKITKKHGSWETRKGYDCWHLLEVA
jgi:glycosyltransferase involved in cell wall biosynthesis